jgi:hypothetical protein
VLAVDVTSAFHDSQVAHEGVYNDALLTLVVGF